MVNNTNAPWTDDEIDAVIEVYFDMLIVEISGDKVIKAERNRELQRLINRSRGSIEYKHRNISAVMADLNFVYVNGYKPAFNYQNALYEKIKTYIENDDVRAMLRQAK